MSTLAHTVIPQASSPLTWHGLLTGSTDETIHERGFHASKHVQKAQNLLQKHLIRWFVMWPKD